MPLILEIFYLPGEVTIEAAAMISPELIYTYFGEESLSRGSRLAALIAAIYWVFVFTILLAAYRYCRAIYWRMHAAFLDLSQPVRSIIRMHRIRSACLFSDRSSTPGHDETIIMEVVDLDELSVKLLRIAEQYDGVTVDMRRQIKNLLGVSERELRQSIQTLADLQMFEQPAGDDEQKSDYRLTDTGKFYVQTCKNKLKFAAMAGEPSETASP